MKDTFTSSNMDSKYRLLDLIRDFLVSEAKRRGTAGVYGYRVLLMNRS